MLIVSIKSTLISFSYVWGNHDFDRDFNHKVDIPEFEWWIELDWFQLVKEFLILKMFLTLHNHACCHKVEEMCLFMLEKS